MRLAGGDAVPNLGYVRIEVSLNWFEARGYGSGEINPRGVEFINQLSRAIYEDRGREISYDRAAISLHPIVRAEASLGTLFCRGGRLRNNFYRLMGA